MRPRKEFRSRLAGVEPPRFEDNEKTIEELRAVLPRPSNI